MGSPMFLLLLLAYLFQLFLLPVESASAKLSPIVKLPQGQLQGLTLPSRNGQTYFAFRGIPFAKQPTRFELPEPAPVPGWRGIRKATKYESICAQVPFAVPASKNPIVNGSDDCLYLNVYTRDLTLGQGKPKPVIVWIHGGAFYFGWAHTFGEKYFMDEDIVLVTTNYRLGPLGFLNVGHMPGTESRAAGNLGLKDQNMALRWVQKNIEKFGGDRNRVTIYGESAGSASVHHHVLSPASRGLFHRAILASGSTLSPWAFDKDPSKLARDLGSAVGCPSETSNELVECLMRKDYTEIIAQTMHSLPEDWRLDPLGPFGPTVEEKKPGEGYQTFLAEEPGQILKRGAFTRVPMIFGFTRNEGTLFHSKAVLTDPVLADRLDTKWSRIAPITLLLHDIIPASKMEEAITEIRRFYFGYKPISNETYQQLEDLYSDRNFVHSTRTAALLHANYGPVDGYVFDYSDGQNLFGFKYANPTTMHADDLRYTFSRRVYNSVGTELKASNREAIEVSEKFVKAFVTFARDGKPDRNVFGGLEWPPLKKGTGGAKSSQWIHVDATSSLKHEDPSFTARMDFWDNLLQKYGNGNGNVNVNNADVDYA